ncbi:16820_t:CDS:1, partial [Funneliformis caledonium]
KETHVEISARNKEPLRKAKTVRFINVRINVGIEPTRKTRNTRNSVP